MCVHMLYYVFCAYIQVYMYVCVVYVCSDAPITELADFPINQYLMANNSRYR